MKFQRVSDAAEDIAARCTVRGYGLILTLHIYWGDELATNSPKGSAQKELTSATGVWHLD